MERQEILEKTGVSFDDPKFSKVRTQYRFEEASNFLGYAGMNTAEKEAAIIKKYRFRLSKYAGRTYKYRRNRC